MKRTCRKSVQTKLQVKREIKKIEKTQVIIILSIKFKKEIVCL